MKEDKNGYSDRLFELNRKIRELERKEKLFDMKWKVLENEIRSLAIEKEEFNSWKDSEERRLKNIENSFLKDDTVYKESFSPALFFSGIRKDEFSLKRRYKDLLKIYHPDNVDGDTGIVQEINREYDKLYELICS